MKDYDESMRFYTKTMGFKEAFTIKDKDGKPTLTYLQLSKDTFLELASATAERPVGLRHIGFWPEDLGVAVSCCSPIRAASRWTIPGPEAPKRALRM